MPGVERQRVEAMKEDYPVTLSTQSFRVLLRGLAACPVRSPPPLHGAADEREGLSRAEGDEAPKRVVGRNAHGHTISRHDLDAEPAHSSAQLSQHFVAPIAFHPVEAAAVDGHNDSVHVDQIVFAQLFRLLPYGGRISSRTGQTRRKARVTQAPCCL